jgi:hypothetical protein
VDKGLLPVGEASPADYAYPPITSPSAAMFPSKINDLEVQTVPYLTRKEAFQISFSLLDIFP